MRTRNFQDMRRQPGVSAAASTLITDWGFVADPVAFE
jgi:hypothetical protein